MVLGVCPPVASGALKVRSCVPRCVSGSGQSVICTGRPVVENTPPSPVGLHEISCDCGPNWVLPQARADKIR